MNTSHSHYQSLFLFLFAVALVSSSFQDCHAQKIWPARSAIVIDERLAALRAAPSLSASLVRRLGRGRKVLLLQSQRSAEGVVFHRVAVTRRTRGWVQREALVFPRRKGDDERLLQLIKVSNGFDCIARARLFLDAFPKSPRRPAVLLILGDEAEKAAAKLSQDAARRLEPGEISATGASLTSYYLNFSGLDRFRRQGIVFKFDERTRQFHYDGAAWNELLQRYGHSPEAAVVRRRQ